MQDLSVQEKLQYVLEMSKKHGITSTEFSKSGNISDMGARNILEGTSESPRTKSVNAMYDYVKSKLETPTSFIDIKALAKTVELYHDDLLNVESYKSLIESYCSKQGSFDYSKVQGKISEFDERLLEQRRDIRTLHSKLLMLEERLNEQSDSSSQMG